jgi:transcriptional regulator with XRE-family HTH domain
VSHSNPISKRLKEAREYARLSQKKLGIMAGINEFSTSASMNQYETGKYTTSFLTLYKIAKVLNIPTAYFYAEDDSLAEITKLYAHLDKRSQRKLLLTINKEITTTKGL